MLTLSIIYTLISNAVTSRRDKSILYSRNAAIILLYCIALASNSIYIDILDKGLSLYGGLLHSTYITHFFQIFIFVPNELLNLVSILTLTLIYI
jgi:NADH-ubiquinone oxidoreductase chain 2